MNPRPFISFDCDHNESKIKIKYNNQTIILQKPKSIDLKKLVSKITKNNLPLEEDNYISVGREVW